MRNSYPGICYRCGKHVEAFSGHFERVGKDSYKKYGWQTTKWLIQHAECAIKYRDTNVHHLHNPSPNLRKE